MKGYVAYPMTSYDEKLLFKDGYMNVTKVKEDVMIWADTWYMEDCYVFEIDFDKEDIVREISGSTEYLDGKIVDVTWWRIRRFNSMELVAGIVFDRGGK